MGERFDVTVSDSELSEPVTKDSPTQQAKKPPDKKAKRPPKKLSTGQIALRLLLKLAVIAAVVWATLTFVLCIHIHHGNNMHPVLKDGDLIVTLRLQQPVINSVVLYENGDGKLCAGRVIALGGSEVTVSENGALSVNGYTPNEEVFYPTCPAPGDPIQYPYKVEAGKVFILNDFRTDTLDSRSFGAVDLKDVKGSALMTLRRRGF